MPLESVPSFFDPFANTFDPDAKPFDPNANSSLKDDQISHSPKVDLSSWHVVAAEYSGKAVAILLNSESVLQVCTSPSFNSKCSHKGLACLDWDTVDMGKGRSATPEPTHKSLQDSGVENFTDNSSEEIDKINRVAKWSAEASRHAEEWGVDVNDQTTEWGETATAVQGWSEDNGQGWTAEHLEWSSVGDVWTGGHTEEYHPEGYHITVEYHAQEHDYLQGNDTDYQNSEAIGFVPENNKYQVEVFSNKPCYGNDPVVVFQPWESQVASTGQSWSEGLGIKFNELNLEHNGCEKNVDTDHQQKVREEFKRKILRNVHGATLDELDKDSKIREDFKRQILSNLSKSGTSDVLTEGLDRQRNND